MAKKKPFPEEKPKTPDDPYRLKISAVDDLVSANEENSPPVSRAELRQYQSLPHLKMSDWVKAILLKIWFAGVICYFLIWGLSVLSINQWDHLLILAIALGAVTHLLTNNIYRFIAPVKGAYDRYMMFPKNTLAMLPLDILYAGVLILCVVMTYNGINLLFGYAALGVEPILFGIFTCAWDLLFLRMKHLVRSIISDAKKKVSSDS